MRPSIPSPPSRSPQSARPPNIPGIPSKHHRTPRPVSAHSIRPPLESYERRSNAQPVASPEYRASQVPRSSPDLIGPSSQIQTLNGLSPYSSSTRGATAHNNVAVPRPARPIAAAHKSAPSPSTSTTPPPPSSVTRHPDPAALEHQIPSSEPTQMPMPGSHTLAFVQPDAHDRSLPARILRTVQASHQANSAPAHG